MSSIHECKNNQLWLRKGTQYTLPEWIYCWIMYRTGKTVFVNVEAVESGKNADSDK